MKWLKKNKKWFLNGSGGLLLIFILTFILNYFFQNGQDKSVKNEQKFDIAKNQNSPITGSINQQTNNFYMIDSNAAKNQLKDTAPPKKKKPKIVKDVTSDSDRSISANSKQINTGLYIEKMLGGVAVGKVENLNIITNKESLGIRDSLGLYKDGKLIGTVINPSINEKDNTVSFEEIQPEKQMRYIDEFFSTYEFRKYIIEVEHIGSITMIPSTLKYVRSKIIGTREK